MSKSTNNFNFLIKRGTATASAFLIDDGWLITCSHVIQGKNTNKPNVDLSRLKFTSCTGAVFNGQNRFCCLLDLQAESQTCNPDLALVKLGHQPLGPPSQWERDEEDSVSLLTPVELADYELADNVDLPVNAIIESIDENRQLQRLSVKIVKVEKYGKQVRYVLDSLELGPGWSGAPLFFNGQVIAVVYGGKQDENIGYAIALKWFISRCKMAIKAHATEATEDLAQLETEGLYLIMPIGKQHRQIRKRLDQIAVQQKQGEE